MTGFVRFPSLRVLVEARACCNAQMLPDFQYPPLRNSSKTWVLELSAKAHLFAHTMAKKCQLPPYVPNEYVLYPEASRVLGGVHMPNSFVIRTRIVSKILNPLDMETATGPDLLSTRVLKQCATPLSMPTAKIARLMLRHGCWPNFWLMH